VAHVKITASLSEELARRLDGEAQRRELSRSSVLGEIVERHFRHQDRAEFQAAIRAVLAAETDEDRAERDAWLRFSRRQARAFLEPETW
jgi:metal-responsive CopG/Arc/MetJ family transcriptional regulator